MLGNVKPFLPLLDEKAKSRYNAFYCGLCKTLGKSYGAVSRFLLNYDMTFVAMIYDDLNQTPFETVNEGCIANPVKKKDILCTTEGTLLAADILILLAYYKLLDNIYDENFFKKIGCLAVYPYFMVKVRKAQKKHPQLAQVFRQESENQQLAEKQSPDTDTAARPTAQMVRAIMQRCAADPKQTFELGQFGFFLGRVIYLLDALVDREKDAKENKFNIFNLHNVADEQAKEECFMALGEMAHWYSNLSFTQNKEIIDNIIYIGLARAIKFANNETEKENNNGL